MLIPPFLGRGAVPKRLDRYPGNCGPVSVWMVLKYFRKRCCSDHLIESCGYTKECGCFTAGLALALNEYGLKVSFHSDPDDDPDPLEQKACELGRQKGVMMQPALDLPDLLKEITPARIAIVALDTDDGVGHFSPLLGAVRDMLVVPNIEGEHLPIDEFLKKWDSPGNLRQCLLVNNADMSIPIKIKKRKNEPWYGAKCVFLHMGLSDGPVYEERVVLVKAKDLDEAIERGEKEAEEYAGNLDDCTYTGFINVFHIFGNKITEGTEVYSLMRSSDLETDEYLDHFYDTGEERTQLSGDVSQQEDSADTIESTDGQ